MYVLRWKNGTEDCKMQGLIRLAYTPVISWEKKKRMFFFQIKILIFWEQLVKIIAMPYLKTVTSLLIFWVALFVPLMSNEKTLELALE